MNVTFAPTSAVWFVGGTTTVTYALLLSSNVLPLTPSFVTSTDQMPELLV